MKSGALRHLLTFQSKPVPEAQDGYGAHIEIWSDEFTVWGSFEPIGTREFPSFQKVHSESTGRFRIRFRTGIDPDRHRIAMTLDSSASPIERTYWDIQRPQLVGGRLSEMVIEAREAD